MLREASARNWSAEWKPARHSPCWCRLPRVDSCGALVGANGRDVVVRYKVLSVPSSHYYLGSLSWATRTFHFPDSRDLLEVLRDFLGRERERGGSLGDPPGS